MSWSVTVMLFWIVSRSKLRSRWVQEIPNAIRNAIPNTTLNASWNPMRTKTCHAIPNATQKKIWKQILIEIPNATLNVTQNDPRKQLRLSW